MAANTDAPTAPDTAQSLQHWLEEWWTMDAYIFALFPIIGEDLLDIMCHAVETLAEVAVLELDPRPPDLDALPHDDADENARFQGVLHWFDQWERLIPVVLERAPDVGQDFIDDKSGLFTSIAELVRTADDLERVRRERRQTEVAMAASDARYERACIELKAAQGRYLRYWLSPAFVYHDELPFPPAA